MNVMAWWALFRRLKVLTHLKAEALVIAPDAFFNARSEKIAELALRHEQRVLKLHHP
jgi:hypothetical protein